MAQRPTRPRRPLPPRPKGQGLTPVQKQQVKAILGSKIESKYFISGYQNTVSNSGVITDLSSIAQGVGSVERTGDTVNLTRVSLIYQVNCSSGGAFASADSYNALRLILFRWKDDSGNYVPTVTDILSLPAAHGDLVMAVYNLNQGENFHIIYDKIVTVFNSPVYTGTGVNVEAGANHSWCSGMLDLSQLGPRVIEFEGAGTTGSGKLFMLAVSDSTFTPHPNLTLTTQLKYTDA